MERLGDLSDDEGIGLIEVVVAMFLLAVLALSILPVLVTGLRLAAANATLAAATQLANDRMSIAQSASPDCDAVIAATTGGAAEAHLDTVDARGVPLRATTTVTGSCEGLAEAETLEVSTTVVRTDTGERLTGASTLVLVIPAVAP